MKFDPKSANTLIADGEYDIEIADAEEARSNKGNDMIKLVVKVWSGGGGPRIVYDYIVNPNGLWRLKQIADATGQQALFDSGEMGTAQLRGQSLRASIKTHKDTTGQYPDKNVIARYLSSAAGVTHDGPNPPPDVDDNIPF